MTNEDKETIENVLIDLMAISPNKTTSVEDAKLIDAAIELLERINIKQAH